MDINEQMVEFPCEFVEITSVNPLISKVITKVCYVSDEPNINGTVINKEVGLQMAQTLPGCPIVGHYIPSKGDFGAHDKIFIEENGELILSEATRPYGFIDIHPKVWFQMEKDRDGIEREYLFTEGYIWTGQYEEAQILAEEDRPPSISID